MRSLEPGALEVVLSDFAPHEARFGNGRSEMQFGERKGCKVVDQTGKFVCFFGLYKLIYRGLSLVKFLRFQKVRRKQMFL